MLNCTRKANLSNFNNQQVTKDFNVSLDKSYQNCRLNKIDKFIKNKKLYISKDLSTLHKRIYEINNANYLSRIKCFKYYKKRYYKNKCFNKHK